MNWKKSLTDIRLLAPDIPRVREAVKEVWFYIDKREKWFEHVTDSWKIEEADWLEERERLKQRIDMLEKRLYGDQAESRPVKRNG
jgi:hypothetical protein